MYEIGFGFKSKESGNEGACLIFFKICKMTTEEIIVVAKSDPKKTKEALDQKLIELKVAGFRILECILYVRHNQNCALRNAMEITINSSAWKNEEEEFLKQQEEQTQEFLEAAKDDIKSIKQTFSPNGEEIEIFIKNKS